MGGYECDATTMATDGFEKGNMEAGCVGRNDNGIRHHVQIGRAEGAARTDLKWERWPKLCALHPQTGHYFLSATASTR